MPFFAGTDEAGYGPNLGPLTVTGTLWRVDGDSHDLYRALAAAVTPVFDRSTPNRLLVADSKQLYSGSRSIATLETGVLSMIGWATARQPTTLGELFEICCPHGDWNAVSRMFWMEAADIRLPVRARTEIIQQHVDRLAAAGSDAGICLRGIDCCPVFPSQFNQQVARFGNKATLLSNQTMQIVARLLEHADDDLEIVCDKHGGRNQYAGLVQQFLTRNWVSVGQETRDASDYAFRDSDRDVVIRFQAGGESFLPTALASMVSKYMRELFMLAWNQFWVSRIVDLKPTKGYPVDARRFKQEIEAEQTRLGIADHEIWRCR